MSPEQMAALRKSMQTFGYLAPIVVDQDNLIADGEHRLLVYKEFNKKTVPAFRVRMSDTERRTYRQVANKLRGYHDSELDAAELRTIAEGGMLSGLAEMIAQDEQKMRDWIGEFNVEGAGETVDPMDDEMPTENKCPKCGFEW